MSIKKGLKRNNVVRRKISHRAKVFTISFTPSNQVLYVALAHAYLIFQESYAKVILVNLYFVFLLPRGLFISRTLVTVSFCVHYPTVCSRCF